MEDARKALDHALEVSRWAVPGTEARTTPAADPGAPWWWNGAEEASQGFLAAMGVRL